jgi:hypothetical protein
MTAAGESQSRWALGCACAKCRRPNKIFNDINEGGGPIVVPLKGEFAFRCVHCGADNAAHVAELARYLCDEGACQTAA